jgi:hypothetical protein
MRSNIYFPRRISDRPSEDVTLKDGGEKESQLIDRLDLRDKGQPVFEVCRGLRGISRGVRMRPSTTGGKT